MGTDSNKQTGKRTGSNTESNIQTGWEPPCVYVTKPELPPLEDYIEQLKEIWQCGWLTNMGEKHQKLENELKAYLNVGQLMLFTNGHMALESVLSAMGLTGEVITTPFTFASTTHAIVRCGLTPVFCDIKGDNYTIDASKIEHLITEKTSAILPVHVYGNICDQEEIGRLARKHGLKVIYDAAHAFGVRENGKSVAEYGDASMLSFHATKVFNTVEGGAVIYHEKELGNRMAEYRNFGIRSETEVNFPGGNAKLDELRAAMGLCNLKFVDEHIEKRKQLYRRYEKRLGAVPGLRLCRIPEQVSSNFTYLPVLFVRDQLKACRDEIYDFLRIHGFYARKYFYPLTSDFACYRQRFDRGNTPVADYVADNILTLPLFSELSLAQVDRICDLIEERLEVFRP